MLNFIRPLLTARTFVSLVSLALRDAWIVWVDFWKCDFGVEHHSTSNRFDFAIAITLSAYSGSVA